MGMLEEVALALTAPTSPIPTSYGALITSATSGVVAVGILPNTPDVCIALLEVPGSPPVQTMTPLPQVENQQLQVLVRHTSYPSGQSTAHALWMDLHRLTEVTLSGTRWHSCSAIQSPYLFERDEKRRLVFTCTYAVQRKVV